ncbi:hypothetical protein [Thioclava sp. GXIMD4215]|uniref:hypothetical protein n=1 Tax=Thioclava sp. GXIMD4215 TaxID=3131928 RepID=UPI00311B0AE2
MGRILRPRYAAQAALHQHIIAEALEAMRARANDAIRIMGVLPQQATTEEIERLEKELYLGLSVIEEDVPDLGDFDQVEDGIGYIIDAPEEAFDAPLQADDPDVSVIDDPAEDGPQDDDPDWWQRGDDL